MADTVQYPGRLIAIDGSRGKDVTAAADAVVKQLRKAGVTCAVSTWDASGLFGDLAAAARGDRYISARTLSLVYAADLAFRLRWEIRPVLDAGGVVIAAPFLETAIAFGAACGLDEEWLRQLMRFAPAADFRARVEEKKSDRGWKRRLDRGYPESGALMLASAAHAPAKAARQRMIQVLDRARDRRIFTLKKKGTAALVTAVTDSRRDGPRPSASRPRSARTARARR